MFMVTDAYSLLLQELGKLLNINDLQPDGNHSCLIKFPGSISIQIEPDKAEQFLIIGCDLGAVPPGKYRELVFQEALKANGQLTPRHGDFAFSTVADKLILQELIPLQNLNGDRLYASLTPFVEKAKNWRDAISRGDVPSSLTTTSPARGGMFGLR